MAYYQIDNKIYYLDLDVVFGIASEVPNSEKVVNTTITQYYGNEEDGSINNGKEIVENKSSTNDTMSNVKYDFIKYLINCLLSPSYTGDGSPIPIIRLRDLSFTQGLCFNTLIEYKILSEVKSDE